MLDILRDADKEIRILELGERSSNDQADIVGSGTGLVSIALGMLFQHQGRNAAVTTTDLRRSL